MKPPVEFKVQVGQELIEQYGKDKIEKIIEDYLNLAILKLSKGELIKDLSTVDVSQNTWQKARQMAWESYGSKYLFKVSP